MPWGLEVWLGVAGTQNIASFFKKHKLPIYKGDPEVEWESTKTYAALPSLHVAQRRCLERAGFTDLRDTRDQNGVHARTPKGPREFQLFHWQYMIEYEGGYDPEAARFGIALSSRYRPTFLDWESAHGTLDPVVLDTKLMELVTIARAELGAVSPLVNEMPLMVVQLFY
jgi:hypothetical protein